MLRHVPARFGSTPSGSRHPDRLLQFAAASSTPRIGCKRLARSPPAEEVLECHARNISASSFANPEIDISSSGLSSRRPIFPSVSAMLHDVCHAPILDILPQTGDRGGEKALVAALVGQGDAQVSARRASAGTRSPSMAPPSSCRGLVPDCLFLGEPPVFLYKRKAEAEIAKPRVDRREIVPGFARLGADPSAAGSRGGLREQASVALC